MIFFETKYFLGSYAKVREAIDSNTLKRVAIKIIKKHVIKRIKGAMATLKNEINIMRKLKHKVSHTSNILNLSLYIILERDTTV